MTKAKLQGPGTAAHAMHMQDGLRHWGKFSLFKKVRTAAMKQRHGGERYEQVQREEGACVVRSNQISHLPPKRGSVVLWRRNPSLPSTEVYVCIVCMCSSTIFRPGSPGGFPLSDEGSGRVEGKGGRVVIGHPRRGLVLVLILYRRGPVTGRCKVPCLTMTAGIMFAKTT